MTAPPPIPARRGATVHSLSRLAGVSVSTVSRALKDDPRIAPATRRRIADLAREAGYMPNVLARSLSGGQSGLIGLVNGPMQNPFYAELLAEAVNQAAERGQRLLILHAGTGPIEDRTSEALLHYRVDGCLVASAELSSRAAAICAERGVPLVMVNRVARLHASAVSCDNEAGGRDVAKFLLAGGHRRPALVLGTVGVSTSDGRERAFIARLAEAGLRLALRLHGHSTYEGGHAAGTAIAALPAGERPDAVFVLNDIMAMGLLDAVREAGLRVPEDLSVVGFDDVPAAARRCYGLTTLAQPLGTMVRRGLDLLAARIADPALPDESVTLRGQLVVRHSARLPDPARAG
ncbi:LacI family DNA-binding transcriptional regulator [Belnapia sp. T6]|uniref:LacI family DNA-binding transcriptional regulator n=1 Tax=Belnapia mucosa TaxID=2804532 RepID=A0ABS1V5L2_9PROT|nr:LacI family DNA-binding transcriptional regulator [Belnapia mucosa]MBL6455588.1 LacI family DNA-binding transcriptional regulator [Belnapia mucosa]